MKFQAGNELLTVDEIRSRIDKYIKEKKPPYFTDASKEIGISWHGLYRFVNFESAPQLKTIKKICDWIAQKESKNEIQN